MRSRVSRGHKLFADTNGEGQVREAAAVQVADFAPADPEFEEVAPSRLDGHTRPVAHVPGNLLGNSVNHQNAPLLAVVLGLAVGSEGE